MRRFYAPTSAFKDDTVVLDEGETRHLRDVLRLKTGDIISVFDGSGKEFECSVATIEKRTSNLQIIREIAPAAPESSLSITVAAAVTPAEKYDLVIQKMMELGAAHIVPLITARTEIKAKAAAARVERWRKIAFESAKQCGRARLMTVGEPVGVDAFWNEVKQPVVFFSERGGKSFDMLPIIDTVTLVYGPKGGWDDDELRMAAENDASIVTFGGRILRAETAAIALTAIIQHRFGDLN
jgi:16S rRNA (uracil1498-N3)-methyltransferase